MDRTASPPRSAGRDSSVLDRERAQAEWLRLLPPEVRRDVLRPSEVARLLDWAERTFLTESPEAMAELHAECTRIAGLLWPRVGHDVTLRCLRDAFIRALTVSLPEDPALTRGLLRLAAHVSDAAWEAHVHALQQTIHRQRLARLAQELTVAKRIQQRLLPREAPQVPGWEIAGRVVPAEEVGGDYWSAKSYPDDGIVTLKLADITGHGIAAATLVSAVKFITGGQYQAAKTAAQVMERTNHVLTKETPHEVMVTMAYGWLFPSADEISLVNAGHSPVLHYRRGELRSIPPTGPALGMIETRYREARLRFDPGDLFFTCSDGVTEPAAGTALGEEWVTEQVRECVSLPAEELVNRVLERALAVYGKPLDDMSVLVVKRVRSADPGR